MRSEQNVHSQEQVTRTTIDRFNEVFNRHDADGLAAFLTEDTVFEDTSPAPSLCRTTSLGPRDTTASRRFQRFEVRSRC